MFKKIKKLVESIKQSRLEFDLQRLQEEKEERHRQANKDVWAIRTSSGYKSDEDLQDAKED